MKNSLLLLIIPLLFISFSAHAGDFRLNTSTDGQYRENERGQTEVPVDDYFGMEIDKPEWDFWMETDMRSFRDFDRKLDDYDLYQAVLHFRPAKAIQIDFGRQFINEGFSAETIDGLRLAMIPYKYVDVAVYTGIPRTVEIGDFNKNDGLLTGLTVGLRGKPNMNAQFHMAWRRNNFRRADMRENDEIRAGANLSHQWVGSTTVLLYGLFEYNLTGTVIDTGTAGVDIYPGSRLALNLEFNYFNVDRGMDRQTILSLFTRGRTLGGRFAATATLVPDWLDFIANYSYQRLEIQQGAFRSGHLLDTAFLFSFDSIGLHIQPGYYFSNSFGGTLHGARVFVREEIQKFYADLGVDFTTYDKITGDNDNAFSTVLWAGYEVLKGLTLSGGFEYNRNNAFTRDVRGAFKVDYHFGHKI